MDTLKKLMEINTFASTDKNKKVLENYTKLWNETKYHIETINADKSGKYEKDYVKIKFNSDDDLPLNKMLKLRMLTIIVRPVFEELLDISEGIDINKINASKECDICHYWYFLD